MTNGQKLRRWRKREKLTQMQAGQRFNGMHPSVISKLETDQLTPGLVVRRVIHVATRGEVDEKDWPETKAMAEKLRGVAMAG